jgi:hypothetical protein
MDGHTIQYANRHGLVRITSANGEGWSSNDAAADPLTLLRTVILATLLVTPYFLSIYTNRRPSK